MVHVCCVLSVVNRGNHWVNGECDAICAYLSFGSSVPVLLRHLFVQDDITCLIDFCDM